jgi:CheY-like chemotaxis protein/DnaJ-domain-containing protein 1
MGHSILCVDADRNLCEVLAKALQAEGYAVAMEYEGERALALIEEDAPDLVLLDLFLPGRDGFSVLEAIRALPEPACRTGVVLLSGCSPTPEYQQRARLLDAVALLAKPVPLERLKGVVAERLGEVKRPVPSTEQPARVPTQSSGRDLSGRLERFSFAALLHHLHGLRASGVLNLAMGRRRKWVQLRDGYPTAVRSNLISECLGNFLAATGRISPEAMHESRRRMSSGRLQGEILVAMEALSEEKVSEALREQAEAKLFDIFGWRGGTFRFEFGAHLQRASGLARRSPANLILRGVRTRMPLERIDAWLSAQRHLRLVRGQESFYRFQEIDLEHVHRRLVEELEQGRPLGKILKADEATRRTVYGLVRSGILELVADGAGERPPAPSRSAPAPVSRPATPDPVHGPEEEARRAELSALAQRFADCSFFEILDVAETAQPDEIRGAYERLAEIAHPDRVNASSAAVRRLAAEVFGHVERAYETLSNPRRRQMYLLDRQRAHREIAAQEEGRRAVVAERHFLDGEAALRQRAYEVALRCFGLALEYYPEEGEYHSHYGWALHLCHPDDAAMAGEALEHCKRGIKLATDREKPYLLLGRLCKAIGRVGAAEKMFTRAVQIQPGCVEALRELRLINMRRQNEKGFIGRLLRR